ncbi:MAG: zinc ABC transporter substrate-binding protein [Clostridia bacterium]|nr:zinc ABC transporter substrate-binding protein [Clostridia bacterium]
MKRLFAFLLVAVIALGSLCGCAPSGAPAEPETARLRIVTTIFPEYDWVMNVLGDNPAHVDVTWLLSSSVDMHSYQSTATDILKISTCDLFVYVGGESDEWVSDALQEATNHDMVVVNLLEVLGAAAKAEETTEGMQAESEEDAELDEHVWLSLRNAALFTNKIASAIASLDPAHADTYKANAKAYCDKLDALDAEYQQAVTAASSHKTVLFGDRFPFRYLTDDYGLSYYAAFAGCSAETEASFETVTFLANKVDELGLSVVLTIEGGDHRLAETIVRSTASRDQRILTLDSMQATTSAGVQNGTTYLSVMEQNLSVLKQALS